MDSATACWPIVIDHGDRNYEISSTGSGKYTGHFLWPTDGYGWRLGIM